ncbi:MAG: lipoyl synthase [Candidatus Wolframiiraptor sp.]|nr:MAG: lipoyl synthase [Candidatus Wolframiiraptor sp.]
MLRKPPWIKLRLPSSGEYSRVRAILRKYKLNTVCEDSLCPNLAECWGSGTFTLMILGRICTRACKFCAIKTGNPGGVVDRDEPRRVAEAVKELGMEYVVITSVTRDDLPDGGASIYAETIRRIKSSTPNVKVEVLIPDLNNDADALSQIVREKPDVIGHNIETVKRLTKIVRDPRAGYEKSLKTLKIVKELAPEIYTKSSIMLGLGETEEEVVAAMRDLRKVGVDILTLGQYLQPTRRHLPVVEYVHPEKFERLKKIGEELGFLSVAAGPLVRSSYKAAEYFAKLDR